jgi:hypothetical protein
MRSPIAKPSRSAVALSSATSPAESGSSPDAKSNARKRSSVVVEPMNIGAPVVLSGLPSRPRMTPVASKTSPSDAATPGSSLRRPSRDAGIGGETPSVVSISSFGVTTTSMPS